MSVYLDWTNSFHCWVALYCLLVAELRIHGKHLFCNKSFVCICWQYIHSTIKTLLVKSSTECARCSTWWNIINVYEVNLTFAMVYRSRSHTIHYYNIKVGSSNILFIQDKNNNIKHMVHSSWIGKFNPWFKYLSRLITLSWISGASISKQCKWKKVQSIPEPLDAAEHAGKHKGTGGHLVWYEMPFWLCQILKESSNA